MNYNHSNTRQAKPKRLLYPSADLSTPSFTMQQGPYMYNQQIPLNNEEVPEYIFNVPGQVPSPYGFNPQMPNYLPNDNQGREFGSPQFTAQFLAQPVVTDMAMEYGNVLVDGGKQYFLKYIPVTALKYHYAVNTDYVIAKLMLLFFPFIQKDWSMKYEQDVPLQPRYDKNAPDMYIPTMAFFTYVAMAGLVLGIQERFTHEQLGILASSALAWGLIELIVHTVSLYVMNLQTNLTTLDLLAYCSYKYVGINTALLLSLLSRKFGYVMLLYFSVSVAFFLIKSLKLRIISQGHSSYATSGNKRRFYFILSVAGVQPVLMWWLSYHLI